MIARAKAIRKLENQKSKLNNLRRNQVSVFIAQSGVIIRLIFGKESKEFMHFNSVDMSVLQQNSRSSYVTKHFNSRKVYLMAYFDSCIKTIEMDEKQENKIEFYKSLWLYNLFKVGKNFFLKCKKYPLNLSSFGKLN